MPITAHSKCRGFTLIEILVVVIIVATISSLALLSLGLVADDRELDRERKRLATLLEVALEDAALQGREFGVELLRNGYRFVEFDPFDERWTAVVDDDLFRLRQLPDGMEFELYVDDRRVVLPLDAAALDETGEDQPDGVGKFSPHLYLSSSGDTTPFEIRVRRPAYDQELVVRGDILGNVEFGPPEE